MDNESIIDHTRDLSIQFTDDDDVGDNICNISVEIPQTPVPQLNIGVFTPIGNFSGSSPIGVSDVHVLTCEHKANSPDLNKEISHLKPLVQISYKSRTCDLNSSRMMEIEFPFHTEDKDELSSYLNIRKDTIIQTFIENGYIFDMFCDLLRDDRLYMEWNKVLCELSSSDYEPIHGIWVNMALNRDVCLSLRQWLSDISRSSKQVHAIFRSILQGSMFKDTYPSMTGYIIKKMEFFLRENYAFWCQNATMQTTPLC